MPTDLLEKMHRLSHRVKEHLTAAGYSDVEIEQTTPGVVVAVHPDPVRRNLAQAIINAFDKSFREAKAIQEVYLEITAKNMNASQHQQMARYTAAERAVEKPDLFKKLGNVMPILGDIVGEKPEAP